jgi:hypothetical protein
MGDEPASFDGKDELLRRSFIPALKNVLLGKAIKRDIQLDRVKIFGVEFKPLCLGEAGRIEGPIPPVGVIIAARPDEDHPLTFLLSPLEAVS